jgi:chemotaxis protein MotA
MAEKAAKPTEAKKAAKGGSKIDLATVGGVILALGGIVTGLLMDGGKLEDVKQLTAALIVFGGTIGAVMVTSPTSALLGAVKKLGLLVFDKTQPISSILDEIIEYATKARKQGIVSLEQEANAVSDPFLKKALNLAVDGIDTNQIRGIMELEMDLLEQRADAEAKVFEAAGGYAPTVGIIGAVLGLMQVMKHLADIDGVGRGIASAFVATVYGVGAANLFFLPAAGKLRARVHSTLKAYEMMLEGVLAIVEGLNPKLIRTKLDAYLEPTPAKGKKGAEVKKGAKAEAQPAPAGG